MDKTNCTQSIKCTRRLGMAAVYPSEDLYLVHLVRTRRLFFKFLKKPSGDRKRLTFPENPPLNNLNHRLESIKTHL